MNFKNSLLVLRKTNVIDSKPSPVSSSLSSITFRKNLYIFGSYFWIAAELLAPRKDAVFLSLRSEAIHFLV